MGAPQPWATDVGLVVEPKLISDQPDIGEAGTGAGVARYSAVSRHVTTAQISADSDELLEWERARHGGDSAL
jgi:hypothetical protein|eukprot:COSAG01_NODE_2017_length_8638_cov_15.453917_6_plen_72_part_00